MDLSSQFHTESNEPSIFGQFGHSTQLQQTALYWIGRTSHVAPSHPPQSRSPRRAELPLRVRNACVLVEVRVALVGLHGGWQPQKERRGVFLATEIPPCRTPMSPNWVMDVRNRLISPRQLQRTIKRAVSY